MFVFEIIVPGTRLDYEDREWSWDVEKQLRHLQSQFFEANAALNLFTEAQGARPYSVNRDTRERESQRRYEIRRVIEQERGDVLEHGDWDEIDFEVNARFKREQWSNGKIPREFEIKIPFLYARAFLYAVDALDKSLGVLAKINGAAENVAKLHDQMRLSFPHLRGVRNSVQHLEDRARSLGAGGKPLDLKPIENNMVNAPGGRVLMLDCLNGSSYGSTMSDGHYGEVDVSAKSLIKVQGILQTPLYSFKWRGAIQHAPSA